MSPRLQSAIEKGTPALSGRIRATLLPPQAWFTWFVPTLFSVDNRRS